MTPTPSIRAALAKLKPDEAAGFVLAQGIPFRPVPLPKGVRRRRPGNCFAVAADLAHRGVGSYVEGFAWHPVSDSPDPVRHAWITTDGTDAVDASWPLVPGFEYLGIPFSLDALARLTIARNYHGQLDPIDDVLREALAFHPFRMPARAA